MKNQNKYIFLIMGIIIGALTMAAILTLFSGENEYQQKKNKNHQTKNDNHTDAEFVTLTEDEISELGIILKKVEPQRLQIYTELNGEIVPDPDKLAHLVPRFTGIVKSVSKKIGDNVKKDEVIAVIESNESLVTYEVKSSIAGVVLEMHMTPGELIGDETHIVTIADLSSVWAELNVYQKDLNKIKIGQKTGVYFDSATNAVEGKIFYLSPTVDVHTRTSTARVRLNNKDGYWKPGMFVSANVLTNFFKAERAVKLNAIQNYNEQKVVFIKEDEKFKPQPVSVGISNSVYAEILSGLEINQIYIAEGAFVIKSEILKESFGGGHAH